MGCGSAKISLTHGRRAGGRRGRVDGHGDGTDSDGHGGEEEDEPHYTRSVPAVIVASTSVDSDIVRASRRPKITTSFSQNDFSTTTSISSTSRIRVTLSHDGSLLEVETETLGSPDDESERTALLTPGRRSRGRRGRPEDSPFPSCSGTQSHPGGGRTKKVCSASSSESSSHLALAESDLSMSSGTRSRGRLESMDEDEDIHTAQVTAFMTVADIEEEPRPRPNRSKSINSILSQAEQSHLLEIESKRKHLCKECGCPKTSKHERKDGGKTLQKVHKRDKDAKDQNKSPKSNPKSKRSNLSSSEEEHEGKASGTAPTYVRKGTPYSQIAENPRDDLQTNPLSDGASPLLIEKHPKCCCYCHQTSGKTGGKSRSKTDKVPGTPIRAKPNSKSKSTASHNGHENELTGSSNSEGGVRPDIPEKPTSCRLTSNSSTCQDQQQKERTHRHTKVKVGDIHPPGPILKKAGWTNGEPAVSPNSPSRQLRTCLESPEEFDVVIVPVAPILDPNAIFNFDEDWGDALLRNGTAAVDSSQNETPPAPPKRFIDSMPPHRQNKKHNHEGVCQPATNSDSSSVEVTSKEAPTIGSAGSNPEGGDGASKQPVDVRTSCGCAQDADDGCDVTDSSKTTVTSSSSTGDVTSILSGGVADGWVLCDSSDPTSICVQVHTDFFNDFCDFFDDEDDCVQ